MADELYTFMQLIKPEVCESMNEWTESFLDVNTSKSSPCANCESESAIDGGHFCSDECQDEYEGVSEY